MSRVNIAYATRESKLNYTAN